MPLPKLQLARSPSQAERRIGVFTIPKRSPDLNVMDFAIWSEVERRMRKQERSWPIDRQETRAKFAARVVRTARALPAEYINKSIADLTRRCSLLFEAKGGLFEEGGRKRGARRPL